MGMIPRSCARSFARLMCVALTSGSAMAAEEERAPPHVPAIHHDGDTLSQPIRNPQQLELTRNDAMTPPDDSAAQVAFHQADQRIWQVAFSDEGIADWTAQWFLDGEVGTVTNTPLGMELLSGPEHKNPAHHMVLWTKDSFAGDLKIEYEFTRLDEKGQGVCIVYIQATGSGEEGFAEDITAWNAFRRVPVMGTYFQNMHTYHISYACEYIRGRRYMPHGKKMNGHTELTPDYAVDSAELFEVGVPYRVTIIKQDRTLSMRVASDKRVRHFHMTNEAYPAITHGRIGLRQMSTRWSRYRDIRICVAK